MNKAIELVALLIVGLGGYGLGRSLSSDAIAMAVGVLFGVLAGIPTALLMLAGNRRTDAPTGRLEADYWRLRVIELERQNRRLLVDREVQ